MYKFKLMVQTPTGADFVFCRNERESNPITTTKPDNAIPYSDHSIQYFRSKYPNHTFLSSADFKEQQHPNLLRWIEEYYSLSGHTLTENEYKGYLTQKIEDRFSITITEVNRKEMMAKYL